VSSAACLRAVPVTFRVTDHHVTSTSVILVTYERAGEVETGTF
jgi:hypothetical protein